jgi:hypothetical protein
VRYNQTRRGKVTVTEPRKKGAKNREDAAAPGGSGVPGHMSLEDQQAQASWTAAIMKVGELKPKSYKDYIRALRTYKVGEQSMIVLIVWGCNLLKGQSIFVRLYSYTEIFWTSVQ